MAEQTAKAQDIPPEYTEEIILPEGGVVCFDVPAAAKSGDLEGKGGSGAVRSKRWTLIQAI